MTSDYKQSDWFQFLDHGMQDLVAQSVVLLAKEKEFKKQRFHDYSFLVFPAAKAYEGFVKKFLFKIGLLDNDDYEDRYFRIGRSMNPELPEKYKDELWLFDDVKRMGIEVGYERLADELWLAWQQARNSLFHYFLPDHMNFVDLAEAERRMELVYEVMDKAVQCGLVK